MVMTPDELAQKFSLQSGVIFPSVEDSRQALRQIGINRDISSYLWAKRTFGHSRLDGSSYEFWIGGLTTISYVDSLVKLNTWWQEYVTWYLGRRNGLTSAGTPEDIEIASMVENWKNFRPFCSVGEYRSIYAWDLTRPVGSDEFEIVHLDYQLYDAGYFPNMFSIYEDIASGMFDDELQRDVQGRAVLRPF